MDILQIKEAINRLETLKQTEDIPADMRDALNQSIIPLRIWLLMHPPEKKL